MMDKESMIRSVMANLQAFIKDDEREKVQIIAEAMEEIDRKHFLKTQAYLDDAASIGYGQTISQPSTVARMLHLADLSQGIDVLEIGAGSGWNACLISYIVKPGKVVSLDTVPQLIEEAKASAFQLKEKTGIIEFRCYNAIDKPYGFKKEEGKFSRIMITAGIDPQEEKIIERFARELLQEQGVLLCPYMNGPMIIIRKHEGKLEKEYTQEHYAFVPLRTGQ